MLSIPKNGWTILTIGSWSDRCSYLDDVPYMLLEAVDRVWRTGRPEVVHFDAEGWENTIVFDQSHVHIISDNCDEGFVYTTIECRISRIARDLIADIRQNLAGWANWPPVVSEAEVEERTKDLTVYCDMIEKRLV